MAHVTNPKQAHKIILPSVRSQDVTWLADWDSVNGCAVPASLETDPAGSLLVLDLSNHESLWRRGNTNLSHINSNKQLFNMISLSS